MNLREMFGFGVPIISVVIGEGGSGGALAIGCANHSFIMENSVYYVASPEACAAILWKARDKAATVSPAKPCSSRGACWPCWRAANSSAMRACCWEGIYAGSVLRVEAVLQATEALRITASELVKFGVMDDIIEEPLGGAHSDPVGSFPAIKAALMDIYHNKCASLQSVTERNCHYIKGSRGMLKYLVHGTKQGCGAGQVRQHGARGDQAGQVCQVQEDRAVRGVPSARRQVEGGSCSSQECKLFLPYP